MTSSERARLLERFNRNAPADIAAISDLERQSGLRLPSGYAEFLCESSGGEGFVGPNAYLILWRVEELLPNNLAYEVTENAPGLLIFGSDGGGEAFAFDTRTDGWPVVSVPFVGMDRQLALTVAVDFDGFLIALSRT